VTLAAIMPHCSSSEGAWQPRESGIWNRWHRSHESPQFRITTRVRTGESITVAWSPFTPRKSRCFRGAKGDTCFRDGPNPDYSSPNTNPKRKRGRHTDLPSLALRVRMPSRAGRRNAKPPLGVTTQPLRWPCFARQSEVCGRFFARNCATQCAMVAPRCQIRHIGSLTIRVMHSVRARAPERPPRACSAIGQARCAT
jgi:hypothetical protein